MVKSPVTQVADVAVKKRSINGTGLMCAMGNASRSAPHKMRMKKEKKIM